MASLHFLKKIFVLLFYIFVFYIICLTVGINPNQQICQQLSKHHLVRGTHKPFPNNMVGAKSSPHLSAGNGSKVVNSRIKWQESCHWYTDLAPPGTDRNMTATNHTPFFSPLHLETIIRFPLLSIQSLLEHHIIAFEFEHLNLAACVRFHCSVSTWQVRSCY